MFVLCLTLLKCVSSQGSSHKADVDWLLAEAQTERVQKLLGMPVRDLLAQIGAESRRRDRCSPQPEDTEPGVGLLITAARVMRPLFYAEMIKIIPGC